MSDVRNFAVLDARSPEKRAQWETLWGRWPGREVFAHPAYVQLYCDGRASWAMCAVMEGEDGTALYPFVMRDLSVEPFWNGNSGAAYDVTTPYGYGGPFAWGITDYNAFAADFWEAFGRWCREHSVISEFVRLSLFADTLLPFPGEREERLNNVVRSLGLDLEAIWMDFEHKVRKNVKRAQSNGLRVEVDLRGERLDDFLRIYAGTMDRRSADTGYYFPRSYFERIQATLPGQFAFFHALHNGRVVSSELALVSSETIYSFLGGTDREAFALRANDLLKYEIIRWAQQEGKKQFVLGGGYEPDDGIFRYKSSFAPDGVVPFYVGTRIHDEHLYATLVEQRRQRMAAEGQPWTPSPSYFPRYRA